jgi:acyl-coenzyme A thioesterase PaaI-like protein
MTFRLVDDLLGRQLAGEASSPAAERLGLRMSAFARGVAVYEMPLDEEACGALGRVDTHVIAAVAEEAVTAAALSALSDDHDATEGVLLRDLRARFERPVRLGDAPSLRAEAIVVRATGRSVRVQADVLCGAERVASFEARCERPRAARPVLRAVA